jgi:hypothetical protein
MELGELGAIAGLLAFFAAIGCFMYFKFLKH